MWTHLLFVLGLVLLLKGADLLVDGSASIARRLKVSDLVIGLTVVAFGTSAPELFVNTIASAKGNAAIAVGNIVGSNIANILLILGVSAVIFPLAVEKSVVRKGIPLSLLAALLLGVLANDKVLDQDTSSALTRIDGLVFIFFFIVFLYYSFGAAKTIPGVGEQAPGKQHGVIKSSLFVILGLIGLSLGGKWIVEGAVNLASSLGISQNLIGLTIVAIGTSLPELATSVVAAHKKNVEIAVGNIVGSNIFNIFFILGISSVIKPLPFQMKQNIDVAVLVFTNLILFGSMFTGRKKLVDRWEGIFFILLYFCYLTFLVTQG